ncbi:helix-turn-helix domain-containing protein [Actinosynnema sp. NPDC023587]|uniref:helix-turn-helix domain-containing protein n=1 Tax=Actinosynnema sp. NPDC023587 TaxID=3154695 RepID=UPI0033FCDED9
MRCGAPGPRWGDGARRGGGSTEPQRHAPEPAHLKDPAEFAAELRALRNWSGLTYRQLEGKAKAFGNTLPASTIATTVGRSTLPRDSFVEAFTRACGLGDEDVRQWLAARRRIAVGDRARTGGDPRSDLRDEEPGLTQPDGSAVPHRVPWWLRVASLVTAVAVGVLGMLGVQALRSGTDPPRAQPPVPGLGIPAVGSWAKIHPARNPDFCLTEGRDRTQRYPTAVAAQHPCSQADLPRTYIEPLGDGVVQIQWHHPKYAIGCLTVLTDGEGRDLVEPRDDCSESDPAQRWRIEPVGSPAAAHFRIRPEGTGQCLSLRDQDTVEGAEIVQGRCSGAADQQYLIEVIPPP